jgi:hypothetical protein
LILAPARYIFPSEINEPGVLTEAEFNYAEKEAARIHGEVFRENPDAWKSTFCRVEKHGFGVYVTLVYHRCALETEERIYGSYLIYKGKGG